MREPKSDKEAEAQAGATVGVWGVYMLMFFGVLAFGGDNTMNLIYLFSAMALIATVLIWGKDYTHLFASAEERAKAKRGDNNAETAMMLLDLLTDEEKQDIRRRLMNSGDGELPIGILDSDDQYEYSN